MVGSLTCMFFALDPSNSVIKRLWCITIKPWLLSTDYPNIFSKIKKIYISMHFFKEKNYRTVP